MRVTELNNLPRITQLVNGAEIQTQICLIPSPQQPLCYNDPSSIFHTPILGMQISIRHRQENPLDQCSP